MSLDFILFFLLNEAEYKALVNLSIGTERNCEDNSM